MSVNLSECTTDSLVEELLSRNIVDGNGLLSKLPWALRVKLGVIPCVDSIAIRMNNGKLEAFAICRNTGPYPGKWCPVGGVIAKGESIEDALRRHWRTDLGCEITGFDWTKPSSVHQHCPPSFQGEIKKDFLPEPTKFSTGLFYKVNLLNEPKFFGKSVHGGQEANNYAWFSCENLPSFEKFAYGFCELYRKILF